MNTWNWLLHFLIIFDLVAFGIYFGGDILFTAISKVQKKSKKDDDLDLYDFEIETAPQKRSLCVDSIRMLYSGEIDEFVEKELLLDAAETMNALSEAEKTAWEISQIHANYKNLRVGTLKRGKKGQEKWVKKKTKKVLWKK